MAKILLDYVFPISVISPTPQASTAFLKQVCVVAKPNGGGTAGDIVACTSVADVEAVTDNDNAEQLFNAGMAKVYVLLANTLDVADAIEDGIGSFYTLLISDDFADADLTDLDVGGFDGVVGFSTQDATVAATQAAIEKHCAFLTNSTNKAKNMFYAFGSLLSNPINWVNQQYITMPVNDDHDSLGDAETLFDEKVSFVIHDDEFGNRLALFCAGGKAIVAPYILKNLMVDLQSKALQWISGNEPQYTIKEAALLETRLQQDVIELYITRTWIAAGVVAVTLEEDNFVAAGRINVSEPKALWRVVSEMRQTL